MHYVLVKHKIKDFDRWKDIYDKNMENRKDNGSKGAHVLRGVDDPQEIVILFEWDNLENARKFYKSQERSIESEGITKPEIYFLEGVGRTSA